MKLLLDFSLTTGIVITILILFLLFKQKEKDRAKKILIMIFLLLLFVFIFHYGYLHRIRNLVIFTYLFEDAIVVFLGPMLFLYVKVIVSDSKIVFKRNIIHFVFPILYLLVISIPSLLSIVNDNYTFDYINGLEYYISFLIIYSLIYCIISLKLLSIFQGVIKLNYSNLENKNLSWIQHLLLGTILIISIDVFTTVFELMTEELDWNIGYLTIVPIVFLIGYLGYYGVSQSKILLPDFLSIDNVSGTILSGTKHYKGYDETEMIALRATLIDIMQNHKPYLREDLTLRNLAELLEITDKKLSVLLNQYFNISFYDYINSFRVEAVKKMIKNSAFEKYTLLAIAHECGFNSKASFNRVFKKVTKISPSEYKKQILIS